MNIDIEQKIMTRKRFSTAVEQLVAKGNMSYIDAATYIIEQRGMDYSNLKKLLTLAMMQLSIILSLMSHLALSLNGRISISLPSWPRSITEN